MSTTNDPDILKAERELKGQDAACVVADLRRENERLRLRVRELESVVGLDVDALREQLSAAQERVRVLEELARHMWVHDGYPQNGYLKMSTEQKHLYCDIVGAEFTPLAPDLDTTSVDASDAALAAEPKEEKP